MIEKTTIEEIMFQEIQVNERINPNQYTAFNQANILFAESLGLKDNEIKSLLGIKS